MPASPSNPRRQNLVRLAAGMVVVFAAVVGLGIWAAWHEPAWYFPRPMGEADVALAEGVERRALSELSAAHRFGEPWALTLTSTEAEVWLNVRLPVWMENQNIPKPPWFGFVAVSFEEGQARIGLGSGTGGHPPVVSITLTPSSDPKAKPDHRVRLGSVPVPSWIIERIAPGLGKQIERVAANHAAPRATTNSEPAGIGTLRLDDGRRVRFTGFDAQGGTLTIHCITLGKPR